jgi:hypothetical protein
MVRKKEGKMLQLKYPKWEDIPAEYVGLYTEVSGEFVLTGVVGLKTQVDIDKMQVGLTKERDEHKATKEKLHVWDGLNKEEITKQLDRLAELEVVVKGSVPKDELDKKLDELTEARVRLRLAPVEREKAAMTEKVKTIETELMTLRTEKVRRMIHDKVRAAALTAKIIPEAEADTLLLADAVFELKDDGIVITKENPYGVTPGLSPEVFFTEMQEKRPHWWEKSVGGGGGGSHKSAGGAGNNPWAADTWNLTEQGRYVKANGMDKAAQLAKLAGTTIGGARPTPRK